MGFDTGIHKDLGRIYLNRGELERAAEEIRGAILDDPDNGSLYADMARIHKRRGDMDAAIDEFSKAFDKGFFTSIHRDLGNIYDKLGEFERAAEEYRKAILDEPDNGALHADLARIYECMGDMDAAIDGFSEAIDKGFDTGIHKDLGRIYCNRGELEQAAEEYRKAILDEPDDGSLHADLARIHERRSDMDAALEEFRIALDKGFDIVTNKDLGSIYGNSGELKRAAEKYRKAILDEPDNGALHADLARIYECMGDTDAALDEFSEAIDKGFDTGIHKDLGRIYCNRGELERAAEEIRYAILDDPDDGSLHADLAKIYVQREDTAAAVEEFRKAFDKGFDTGILRELVRLYNNTGELEQAAGLIRSAILADPDNGELNSILADIYSLMNDYDACYREIHNSLNKGYENESICMKLGIKYRAEGKLESSIEYFNKALDLHLDKNDKPYNNHLKNEIEISQKKTIIESHPRGLYVTLTNRCNAQCIMCCVEQTPAWDIPDSIIDEVVSCFPHMERVYWLGGEVFLYRNFEKLFITAMQYKKLKQIIITNGLLIDEKWSEIFASSNLNLVFSIDGLNKKTYEHIRKGSSFSVLKKNIDLVNKNKTDECDFRTGMNFIILESNYKELNHIVEFAKDHEFGFLTINGVQGNTDQKALFNNNKAALDYVKNIIPEIKEKAKSEGIIINTEMNINFEVNQLIKCQNSKCDEKAVKESDPGTEILCLYPWRNLVIDVFGGVKPWLYCRKKIGDVSKSSLKTLWNNEIMQQYRTNMISKNCDDLCENGCVAKFGDNVFSERL